DVRGTGKSTNLTCDGGRYIGSNLDYRDRSAGNLDLILDSVRLAAEYCQQYGGEFGPLVNTEQTVRDLDLLRALLGRHLARRLLRHVLPRPGGQVRARLERRVHHVV